MKKKLIFLFLLIFAVIIIALFNFVTKPIKSDKTAPTLKSDSKIIKLDIPQFRGNMSLEEAILRRRSRRDYSEKPLTLTQISQLLWSAYGITSEEGFRTIPSAGALYPLQIYAIVGNALDIENGVYKYIPENNEIINIAKGDKRKELYNASLQQSPVSNAPLNIVIAAVYQKTKEKYADRAERYVHMEAGHASQNIYLQAEALDLATVTIGAFDDLRVKEILSLEEDEEPLYIMPVGRIR